MRKFKLRKFFTPGLRLLLLLFEIQNVLQNQCETQFVCVSTSTPRYTLARTVKLKQGVILDPEFRYFDQD